MQPRDAATRFAICLGASLVLSLAGCATRSADVSPAPTSPGEFATWDCARIDDELDAVQQRAADVAYSVDQRAGGNVVALGVGLAVFWPAILAMRPDGLEAAELARLKGRYEALQVAGKNHGCPPLSDELPPTRAAAYPVALNESLVYEDRVPGRSRATEWALRIQAVRRGEIEYQPGGGRGLLRQDRIGNLVQSPDGALAWPHLLRGDLVLGAVTAGDIIVSGDPLARARMRGQVVAVGPQLVAGRRFDVAVVELFGDAPRGADATRVEGVIVVDRASGVLLRLDLQSAQAPFSLQRRLVRVEAAPAPGR
jgi:hypothetical protein